MKKLARIPTSGTYPLGFAVGSMHAGVKKQADKDDLAVITSTKECSAAGVFTSNIFKAAPVQVDQKVLSETNGVGFKSVLVNSGNANAVTGVQGIKDAYSMISAASKASGGGNSLCMSTGVIGQNLPIEKITGSVPKLFSQLGSDHDSWMKLAKGMMTTDTYPKLTSTQFSVGSHTYNIAGIAKGGGMISPNMATLLGFVATDAPVSSGALKQVLKSSVDLSFNSISVDGDMSTNDTILALANGAAGGPEITDSNSAGFSEFQEAVRDVSTQLAKLVARDGEGATKFVQIDVEGAENDASAKKVARTIGDSLLVKTALFGKDANWGRILCAIGYSGEKVDPFKTTVSFKPTDGTSELQLCVNGEPEVVDEDRALEILSLHDLNIHVDLGAGTGKATFWTCDLTHDYVTINGEYRS